MYYWVEIFCPVNAGCHDGIETDILTIRGAKMPLFVSPTKREVRDRDPWGEGRYGAPRGKRYHRGVDYVCTSGQTIYSPIAGKVESIAKPYPESDYSGVLIMSPSMAVKMFYFQPLQSVIGEYVDQLDLIGGAQDISQKYDERMMPHIHVEIVSINPEIL